MNNSLDELIPFYPDLSKNDSQLVVHALAEFQELTYTRDVEPRVKRGKYFKHQQTGQRMANITDNIFIIDAPGTGKSCKFAAIDEMFKGNTNLFNKYYMISLSGLLPSLKFQFICKCTDNKYANDEGGDKTHKKEIIRSKKDPFSKSYAMRSYEEFFKELKDKSAEELRDQYSYCVFNLDEVTNIINADFSKREKLNRNGTITWAEIIKPEILMLKEITDMVVRGMDTMVAMNDTRIRNSNIMYIQYWRLMHCIRNSKIIFASGTPMMNRPSEMLMLCNCLLPLTNQIDLQLYANNVFFYNLKKYERYFNGLFLFVDSSNVVAIPRYHGRPLNITYLVEFPDSDTAENPNIIVKKFPSQYILYKVELFGFQNQLIYDNREKIKSGQINTENDQILCFVDAAKRSGTIANTDEATIKNLSRPGIDGLHYQMLTCGLYAEMFRIEEERYVAAKAKGLPGPGMYFNYMYLVNTAIGSFIEIFKVGGYEVLYLPEHFQFLGESSGDYCNIGSVTFTGLTKCKRAVFLTGSIHPSVRERILQVAGSKSNIHGEYIQFIDGSEVMGIGVNIKNAIGMDRPIGEWNEAKDKQSRDRVFREDGHDDIREYRASLIEKETGVKPDIYSFDIEVDVYNMCAFTRHFYVNQQDMVKIMTMVDTPQGKVPKFMPFETTIEENTTTKIKTTTFVGEQTYEITNPIFLLRPQNITHLVGFCRRGGERLLGTTSTQRMMMTYAKVGDNAPVELSRKLRIPIETDLIYLNDPNMDMIVCNSGIIYIKNTTDPVLKMLLSDKILLYHNDCDFMKNYISGFYRDECFVIKMLDTGKDYIASPESQINVDYELFPVHMRYLSSTEKRYIQLEEKSFGTRRLFRIAKRFASDCIHDHERTYSTRAIDDSLECDYENCNYICSSEILVNHTTGEGVSSNAFLYRDYDEYWNNYEILYSKAIIDECRDKIIRMFDNKTSIDISEIFNNLIPEYKREYFINMAIYELVAKRHRLTDRFGFNTYITASNSKLFLRRDFPIMVGNYNDNGGNYAKKLIGVLTNPDYRGTSNSDEKIFNEIETINADPQDPNYHNIMIIQAIERIKKLSYSTIKILIERCFGRIAYCRVVDPIYQRPEYKEKPIDSIIAEQIFGIRCIAFDYGGIRWFVHSYSETKENTKQGEIAKIRNPKVPPKGQEKGIMFWIFQIVDDVPSWRPPSGTSELQIICDESARIVNTAIQSLRTKVLDYNGAQFQYFSDYYLSYFEGTYRLTKGNQPGENIDSITYSSVGAFLMWVEQSPFIYYPINRQIYTLIKEGVAKKDVKYRNSAIKKFFEVNDLIFYYNMPQMDNENGTK